jgi:hypothetical protein
VLPFQIFLLTFFMLIPISPVNAIFPTNLILLIWLPWWHVVRSTYKVWSRHYGLYNFRNLQVRTLPSAPYSRTLTADKKVKKKVKLSLYQAVKAHRVVIHRGFHIFSRQSAHRWRRGCQPYAPAALYPPGKGSVVGWDTILQAGRSRVRVPMRWIFFNLPNPFIRTMTLGSTQPRN